MTFEWPDFTLGNLLYTAVGAAIAWGKWGRWELQPYAIPHVLDLFLSKSHQIRPTIEMLAFISIGTFIGVSLASPTTTVQAIAVGAGWTTLFSTKANTG